MAPKLVALVLDELDKRDEKSPLQQDRGKTA